MEIEVFRAGNAAADAAGITAADLADVAGFDCSANPVAHVMGHPMSDTPAVGPIRKFIARGASLFADLDETSPGFAKVKAGVKDGSILNRSMMFFGRNHASNPTPGKIAPKHLGWLGGAAPGIAGMAPLAKCFAFAADGDTLEITGDPAEAVTLDPAPTKVISFTAPAEGAPVEGNDMTPEEIKAAADKLAVDQADHDAKVKAFAADQKTARETANAATVDGLVTATKVLPADRDDLLNAFNAVDGGEVIAFAADATKKASPLAIITAIMAKGGNVVPVAGEGDAERLSPDVQAFAADGNDKLSKVRKARMDKYGK